MNLENIILNERNQSQKVTYGVIPLMYVICCIFHLHEMPGIEKSIES